ncbi:MAG: Rpn family recombination-promoting nuclease/putative transposase [Gammaproteobacteria bacterium]|nr:Rpn family recombination-promoting nuclease/putative transposase [Gammaproteobacteria bacterium]
MAYDDTTLNKFLDPKNDIAFKRIFGEEKNKDILLDFINSVLQNHGSIVESIEFIPTINVPDIGRERVSIVDIMCRDNHGKKFIIEMQVVSTKEYLKRAQYYAARAYIKQRTKSAKYAGLKEVIFLAICAGIILLDHDDYISYHQMLELNTHERHLKEFSFTFIELGKFNKTVNQLTTTLDKWVYFFKHAVEAKSFPESILKEAYIHKALDELSAFNWTDEELEAYEHSEAEHEAYVNGMEEAEEKGMQKGRQEVAKNLLRLGMEDSAVASATNLTLEQVKSWE